MNLIAERKWVYALSVKGRFQNLHRYSAAILVAFLVGVPWLTVDGKPLIRLDLAARRVHLLGTTLTAADGEILLLLGLGAAFSLFFFTSLVGRLWCGYACPQTVFMEEFVRPIEKFLEGERSMRMANDKAAWGAGLWFRKVVKHVSFLTIGFVASMSFMGFFAGPYELWTGAASVTEYGVVGFFTLLWYADFAWMREQTCNNLCPYARFQSALTDEHSLLIAYDVARGEPRGKAAKEKGGCIDCKRCVNVCPQGIDIRDGFQLECVQCARCVDACDDVMGRLGHPSLVRYSSMAADAGLQQKWIRPRTVIYAAVLSLLATATGAFLYLRSPVEVMIARAPGSLFQVDPDGGVRNTFLLKVTNLTGQSEDFTLNVHGLADAELNVKDIHLDVDETRTVPLVIKVPAGKSARTMPFEMHVVGPDDDVTVEATFKGDEAVSAPGEG